MGRSDKGGAANRFSDVAQRAQTDGFAALLGHEHEHEHEHQTDRQTHQTGQTHQPRHAKPASGLTGFRQLQCSARERDGCRCRMLQNVAALDSLQRRPPLAQTGRKGSGEAMKVWLAFNH
jgi:hypothetical protein